ncbi:10632_t:CDS:2, partial [Dentiscutata heterogama]
MSTTPYSIHSNVNGVDINFIKCDCGQFYISFRNNRAIFTIPTDCVTALNLRIERHDLSRHAGNLWQQLKTVDTQLVDEFKRVAHLVAQQCYSEIRIINVNIPIA